MLLKRAYVPLLFFAFIGHVMVAVGVDDPCVGKYTPLDIETQTWAQEAANPIISHPPTENDSPSPLNFPLGEVRMVTLHPEDLEYINYYRGFFRFKVSKEGIYRVSLGHLVWISFFTPSIPVLDTVGYARQEECSEVKKMVEFQLLPDIDYTLLISGSKQEDIRMMIFMLPEEKPEERPEEN